MANVACRNLTRRFGPVTALAGVSCEVPAGSVLLILGPSGAGKTTLLRLVAGLDRPDEGTVTIAGRLVSAAAGPGQPAVHVPPHERGLALVFERPTLWPHLTALENTALALVGRGLPRRTRRRRAESVLDRLGMRHRLRAWPATLSAGERQRVNLARALLVEPEVLLLDEPFASLDVERRRDLLRHLATLKAERGVTMLWVSHRSEEVLALADRVLLLRRGAVDGTAEAE